MVLDGVSAFRGSCLPLAPLVPVRVSLCWMVCPPSRGSCLPLSPLVSLIVSLCWIVCPPSRFQRVASLGRMILPLSPGLHPTLGALGRMSLHLSSTCLSHLSATLGALGRMSLQFTLVSHTRLPHLSFTLVSHSGCLGPHEFTLVSHLSRMSLHLSHTCLWVPWAA